ncbi:biotin/lipoyl-containing protein [Lederbergia lenta]|uniref:Biotin-requiring enzyme domain-containing protein n=1 Tax=Lederbergia lenta TaxID=1467 RepID=A0A2X4ZJ67_LEDLE|nr:biotin/lipoyl-containing protein [Lederbergia lenta]MCM3110251.1 biotin/lipoyl-binding protein [Lederbergia lenta]MEC2324181.1 biotin/lipoyl-binding protein [Lederbergia lenta]SQI60514.1 biotin-requiring enzyme domain-containing protein [Lederbergia lenta]
MKQVLSTMAGIVLDIKVSKGDQVNTGLTVIMLESMKMVIPIESLDAGIVEKINVAIGDFVNEGDTLLILR